MYYIMYPFQPILLYSDEGLTSKMNLFLLVFNLPLSIILHVFYTDTAHASLLASSIFYPKLHMYT
jgi:hypothetical protein